MVGRSHWVGVALLAVAASAVPVMAQDGLLRVASWNVLNRPNDATDLADLETILTHAATVSPTAAGARPWDILALLETDTASLAATTNAFNGLFGGGYRGISAAADNGGDRTGFIYDDDAVELLSFDVLGDPLTHNIGRAQFRLRDAVGDNTLFAYAVHLKSGATASDLASRGAEAAILATDARSLPAGSNVLFGGDFNWLGGSEAAYGVLDDISYDPIGYAASYRDNDAFRRWHTQDPGGAVDDRFDAHLLSSSLIDGLGLDYLADSYTVLGNDGSHLLNGSILSGTGADGGPRRAGIVQRPPAGGDRLPL